MFFRRYTISTQLRLNPLPFLCLFCPISAGRKNFSTDIIFCFDSPLSGKILRVQRQGICPISHHLRVAISLATPKFSEIREEGRQPVIARRRFHTPHRDGVPTAPLRCRISHRQWRDIFGSARLCAVPLDLLTQACLLYDSLSSWGA